MIMDPVRQVNVVPTSPGEQATACLARPFSAPAISQRGRVPGDDLLLLAAGEHADIETSAQLEQLRAELGGLGVSPIVWDGLTRRHT